MGNSVSQMEPYSKVMEGNLERGNDVLAYSWDKLTENPVNLNIKEHLSNGSTIIYQSYANVGLATRSQKNNNENVLETNCKSRNKNIEEDSSAVARKGTVTSPEKITSDFESRGQAKTLRQDLLVDVVYSLRSLFISYLNSTGVSLPSRNCTNQTQRSVSFNLGENPKRSLPFLYAISSSVLKVKKRSSIIKASSKDDNKINKDDNSICGTKKDSLNSSELNHPCNQISDNQIIELTSTLKILFDVDEISIIDALDKAQHRQIPKRRFSVEIVEGRRLQSKAFKDTINPYCLVRIVNDNDSSLLHSSSKAPDEIFKSNIIYRTTEPLWNGRFNIDSDNSDLKICFEVWHSPLEKGLADKIPLKGLKKETRNLIGYVFITLQDRTSSVDEWLKLVKRKQTDISNTEPSQQKERGEIRVRVNEIKDVHLTLKDKQNFCSLLYAIAQSHAREIEGNVPFWCGSLSSSETILIENYCKVFNISSRITCSSWWLVLSSEQISVSQKFLFSLVQGVTECLETCSPCEEKEGVELVNSVISWISLQITKLKTLEIFYPSSSEVNSKSQLTYSLRTLKELEEKIPSHVLSKTVHPFNLCISEALEEFLESWWKKTLSLHQGNWTVLSKIESNQVIKPQGIQLSTCSPLRGTNDRFYRSLYAKNKNIPSRKLKRRNTFNDVESTASQVQHQSQPEVKCQPQEVNVECDLKIIVKCLTEAYELLQDISKIYNPVFYREYKVPFYRQSYIYLSNELSNLIQPLLSQLYIHQKPVTNLQIKADPLALEVGTPVYEIYKFIRKIEQLNKGYEFSTDIQLQSGFNNYWKWLSKGLRLWLHRTFLRAKRDLIREIQEESLNQNQRSFSAKSALETHDMILNAWVSLKWPEEDQKSEWVFRLSEILCSLSLTYCHELRRKTEDLNENLVVHQYFRNTIEKQLCFAITNITEVTEAVKDHPEKKFVSLSGFEHDREKIFRLVNKTFVEMNLCTKKLMGKLIEKVLIRTEFCLKQSCDMENISSFEEFLCDDILGKKNFLCEKKFKEFLNMFLEGILSLILKIINENKEGKGHLFFGGLSTCLEKCLFRLKFEYPEISCENNENYKDIIQNISYLKLSKELLALNYFKQRYREQIAKKPNYYLGQIAVRTFFKMNGTLTVNVILAKDIHILQSDILKSLILGRPVERKDQIVSPSSYVVVKVVPTPKSSKFQSFRTKVQNKTSNPVYDSTFEFNLGFTGPNSREGFLVHSIFNKDCCSIDRLIGEALLPLSEIPCLPLPKPNNYPKSKGESSSKNCDHPVLNNVFLNLTYPREFKEYRALQVLKLRSGDKNT